MNKQIVTILLIVIAVGTLVVSTILYLNNRDSANKQNAAEMVRQENQPEKKSIQKPPKSDSAPTPGRFVDYSDDIIANTPGRKILFFHAPWCPQCRMIESDIKAQPELPEDTTIIKIDYDSNQELRQKYGVTLQTTFVLVDDAGNLEKKYVAYDEPNFQSVKDNLLD